MPRLASGLAMRARRSRPSEKTASRANPGPSSARPSVMRWPPRGGAGSARPLRNHHANPNIAPFWQRAFGVPFRYGHTPWLPSGLSSPVLWNASPEKPPSRKTASSARFQLLSLRKTTLEVCPSRSLWLPTTIETGFSPSLLPGKDPSPNDPKPPIALGMSPW